MAMMGYQSLFDFEQALAEFTGAPYVAVTDGCTNALELCLRHDQVTDCKFTAFTYLSVPMLMARLGIRYRLTDESWIGEYQLHGTRIWDSARLLRRNMYRPGQMQCLSFGNGKPMQLGRVGCVLTDDHRAWESISRMRSDGRDLRILPWISQQTFGLGFHYCPTLESCERGLELLPHCGRDPVAVEYPDCRKITIDV
jgi:dTDP-4-amino-4,6-dideoxygalactose transaminase